MEKGCYFENKNKKKTEHWGILAFVIAIIAFLLVFIILFLHLVHVNDVDQHDNTFIVEEIDRTKSNNFILNTSTIILVNGKQNKTVLTLVRGEDLANQGTLVIIKNNSSESINVVAGSGISFTNKIISISGNSSIMLISTNTTNRITTFVKI